VSAVRTMTVLVVDDHDQLRQMAVRFLTTLGHRTLEAQDADQAEAALQRHGDDIEAVLLDLNLGGSSGTSLATRLEAMRPGLRVLFMSGYGRDDYGAPELVGRPFIEKPFSVGALQKALASLWD
jgi:two-component system, cell cycle sensor histidine kinase and response regulator CckA